MNEPRPDYYRKVIAGLTEFQKLMPDLDVAVTGVPPERAVSQYHHMPTTTEEWINQPGVSSIFYLADAIMFSQIFGNLQRVVVLPLHAHD